EFPNEIVRRRRIIRTIVAAGAERNLEGRLAAQNGAVGLALDPPDQEWPAVRYLAVLRAFGRMGMADRVVNMDDPHDGAGAHLVEAGDLDLHVTLLTPPPPTIHSSPALADV